MARFRDLVLAAAFGLALASPAHASTADYPVTPLFVGSTGDIWRIQLDGHAFGGFFAVDNKNPDDPRGYGLLPDSDYLYDFSVAFRVIHPTTLALFEYGLGCRVECFYDIGGLAIEGYIIEYADITMSGDFGITGGGGWNGAVTRIFPPSVPIPAALQLLATALIGGALISRSRRRHQ